jgi:O-antigen/teichoic acid export membrane protein
VTRRASLVRNVFSNWIVLATNIAFALVLTPVIVRALDTERYGVWSFLNILVGYSELLYLGLGSALVKHVAQARARHDAAAISRLSSVVASIYSTLGIVCLLVFVVLAGFVSSFFAEPLTPAASHSATIACLLLGVRLFTIFVASAFAGVLTGHDRYDLVNSVYLGSIVIRFVATPILLATMPDALVTLAAIVTVVGTLEATVLVLVAFRTVPDLVVRLTSPRRDELVLLYGFGLQSFFILLAVKLISHTDITVIGVTLGAASVALYALPLQLIDYARMSVGGFAGVFLPRLTILATEQAHDQLRYEFVRAARIAFFISAWVNGTLIALGPAFLSRWVGAEFSAGAQWILVWLGLASCLHVLITQVPLAFYQALGLMATPALVLVLEGIVNIALSVWLAPIYGITGVAFATAAPVVGVSFIVLVPYLCRHLGLRFWPAIPVAMAPGLLLVALNLPLQWGLGQILSGNSYVSLAVRAVMTLPIAALVFVTAFPAAERQSVRRLIMETLRPGEPSLVAPMADR